MKMASEKQINYFLTLYKRWIAKMKREYRYLNKENSTTVSLMNAFQRDIENGKSGEIPMKQISLVINILKDELNS